MIDQEIFDKVAEHLLKQSKKSLNQGMFCCLRGQDGCKCSIGCLIPESLYSSFLESMTLEELYIKGYLPELDRQQLSLLRILQYVHDSIIVDKWKARLVEFAERIKLSTEVLEQWEWSKTANRYLKKG